MRTSPLDPAKVRAILDGAGLKYGKFAKHVGVPPKEFSQFLNGWLVPNANYVTRIRSGLKELIPLFEALQKKTH